MSNKTAKDPLQDCEEFPTIALTSGDPWQNLRLGVTTYDLPTDTMKGRCDLRCLNCTPGGYIQLWCVFHHQLAFKNSSNININIAVCPVLLTGGFYVEYNTCSIAENLHTLSAEHLFRCHDETIVKLV